MERLDPLYTPLSGFNLIEASAGSWQDLHHHRAVSAAGGRGRDSGRPYPGSHLHQRRHQGIARPHPRAGWSQIRPPSWRGRAAEDDDLAIRLLDLMPDREIAIRRLTNAVRGFRRSGYPHHPRFLQAGAR
ncbi:MAG: hypothetical protein MZV65_46120 [Chromatiales bacterium]|nr:hypothetical protein [Chromatiales bacterium]